MLNGHQCILHCFVNQGVDTGYKKVDGTEQGLAILAQKLLSFCIIPKLVLQKNTYVLHAYLMKEGGGWGCVWSGVDNTLPVTLGTSGWGQWKCLQEPVVSAPCTEND